MAELHRRRLASVFAADADLQVGPGRAAPLGSHFDQLADAFLIQHLERIILQYAVLYVEGEELRRIVPRPCEPLRLAA
jgi:hypothetical protein